MVKVKMAERCQSKRAFVAANGCPENRIDAARQQELLRAAGWDVASSPHEADLVFFSACGVMGACEDDSIRAVQALKRALIPGARLVVGGCLTKINPRRLAEVFEGAMVPPDRPEALGMLAGIEATTPAPRPIAPLATCRLGNHGNRVNGAARAPLRWLRRVSPGSLADRVLANLDHMRAHRSADLSDCPPGAYSIKVGSGCRGECAYCAVKNSRGAIKSAAPDEVLGSFRDGLARGYADFVLLGTDQGSYGADIGTDLIALLRALVAEAGDYSIRIRNLEPMGLIEMFPRLREILACGRISLISTPVQSGSDRVLKRMKRPYSVQEIAACVRAIRRDHPQVRLRTQVMVGFPGETGEDFRATLAMLDDLRFDYVEVYRFSPRPNTEAAAMPDQVPERVKGRRHRAMLAKVMLRQLTARAAGGARNARHPRGVLAVD